MKRSGLERVPVLLVRALALLLLADVAGAISNALQAADAPLSQKKPAAASASMVHPEHLSLAPADLKWENAPAMIPAGAKIAARMHHFAWSSGETIVQVHGMGPFKIIYLNPADDPSGMQGKSTGVTKKRPSPKKGE